MIPKERNQQPPAPGERANGHTNGHSLSRIASTDEGVTLAFAGEIDLASADKFSRGVCELANGEGGEVVLNLEDCGFIDSTGLRALIMLGRDLRTRGQALVLSGLNGGPRRALEITGLLEGPDFEVRDGNQSMSAN